MSAEERLRWMDAYEATGSAALVCARFHISRPTLRKWWRRYKEAGPDGLEELEPQACLLSQPESVRA